MKLEKSLVIVSGLLLGQGVFLMLRHAAKRYDQQAKATYEAEMRRAFNAGYDAHATYGSTQNDNLRAKRDVRRNDLHVVRGNIRPDRYAEYASEHEKSAADGM